MISVALITSCSKEEDAEVNNVPTVDITVSVSHEVDGVELVYSDIIYANKAGNKYEVTRLEYYLSDFAFLKSNGEWYKPNFTPVLIDGKNDGQSFVIENVYEGEYSALSFMVGIPAVLNISGSLDNNLENLNILAPIIFA